MHKKQKKIDEFDSIVAELVDFYMRQKGDKRLDIARIINKTENYVNKIHSIGEKRYNLHHLYLLSEHWKVEIKSFLPTIESLNNIERFRTKSLKEKKEFIDGIKTQLEGENNE